MICAGQTSEQEAQVLWCALCAHTLLAFQHWTAALCACVCGFRLVCWLAGVLCCISLMLLSSGVRARLHTCSHAGSGSCNYLLASLMKLSSSLSTADLRWV